LTEFGSRFTDGMADESFKEAFGRYLPEDFGN
jgi:hypothetical protein